MTRLRNHEGLCVNIGIRTPQARTGTNSDWVVYLRPRPYQRLGQHTCIRELHLIPVLYLTTNFIPPSLEIWSCQNFQSVVKVGTVSHTNYNCKKTRADTAPARVDGLQDQRLGFASTFAASLVRYDDIAANNRLIVTIRG